MDEILRRSFVLERAEIADDEGDGRTLEMQAVPWDVEAVIAPNVVEVFDPGAANAQLRAAHRLKLTLGHPRPHHLITESLIGNLVAMESRDSGLWVRSRVATTRTAEEALTLIRDGVLDEVSIGFVEKRTKRTVRDNGVTVLRRMAIHLDHLALVPAGNFGQEAKVLAVRDKGDWPGLAELRALSERLG